MDLDEAPAVARGPTEEQLASYAAPQDEENWDDFGPEELLLHSNWKARKYAFEMAVKVPEDSKELVLPHLTNLIKEGNAAALEALLELLVAYLESGDDATVATVADASAKIVVLKGLVGRPKTAKLAQEIMYLFALGGRGEQATEAIVGAFGNKVPKVRLAAVTELTRLISEFGVSCFPMKAIFKSLTPLFNDLDGKVRKQTMQLCCQCYRFTGPSINSFLGDLRDVQVKELEEMFASVETGAQPEKAVKGGAMTRPSQRIPLAAAPISAAATRQDGGGESGEQSAAAAAAAQQQNDIYDMLDATSVFARLPKNFYAVALDKNAKWQERAGMVNEQLLPLLEKPKIKADDDYSDLVKAMRDLLNDPQGPIQTLGFKCIQAITNSLRQDLAPYARHLVPSLFEKFKEKKGAVLEQLHLTLHGMVQHQVLSFDSLQDEIDSTSNSKIPNQRSAVVNWCTRMVEIIGEPRKLQRLCRSGMHMRLVSDEKIEVRDASLKLLHHLYTLCGESHFKAVCASLDEKQMQKVLRGPAPTSSSLAASARSTAMPPPSARAAPESSGASSKPRMVKALSAGQLKPSGSGVQGSNAPTPSSSTKTGEDLDSSAMSLDDAIALVGGTEVVGEFLEMLQSKEWKGRVEGANGIKGVVDSWDEATKTTSMEAVVVIFKTYPGFKESIFQVFNSVLFALNSCLCGVTSLSHRTAYLLTAGVAPKLAENKSKNYVRELLSVVVENVGPKFVMKHLINTVQSLKKPTLTTEALDWIETSLLEFPQAAIDAKFVVEFVTKFCFESPTPTIKNAGIKLLVTLHSRVGPKLQPFLNDVNPHLKSTIDAEIEKASQGRETREITIRTVKACAATAGKATPVASATTTPSAVAASSAAAARQPLDGEDFPATDVSPQLNAALKQMGSADWKERLAAVKKIDSIMVAANKNVAPNGITECIKALKGRFDEPNKNLVIDVLRTLRVVAESAGPQGSRPGLKFILPSILALLADQKPQLRDEAYGLSQTAFEYLGFENIVSCLPKACAMETQVARLSMVNLMEPVMLNAEINTELLNLKHTQATVPPLLKLAIDRTAEVRSKAEALLVPVSKIVGFDYVRRVMKDFKPAEQQQLRNAMERVYDALMATSQPAEQQMPAARQGGAPASPVPSSHQQGGGAGSKFNNESVPANCEGEELDPTRMSRKAAAQRASGRAYEQVPRQPYTVREICSGIRSSSAAVAINMCMDLTERHMDRLDDEVSGCDVITVLVDRMHSAFFDENHSKLALQILQTLIGIFQQVNVARSLHVSSLYDFVGEILTCLLSDIASQDKPVIKALNELMKHVITFAEKDNLYQALMNRLNNYSARYLDDPIKMNHKYVEVTVKCLFRFKLTDISVDTIIMTAYECLQQHPPSAFKDRDDLTIRTIKTILQDAVKEHGQFILDRCIELVGKQCLVYNFLHVCYQKQREAAQHQAFLDQQQQQSQENDGRQSQRYVDPTESQPQSTRSSTRVPGQALGGVPSNVHSNSGDEMETPMGKIFAKIRRGVTCEAGFDELYAVLRDEGDAKVFSDFDTYFHKCSDVFKNHVQRKLMRLMRTNGEEFEMPPSLMNFRPSEN